MPDSPQTESFYRASRDHEDDVSDFAVEDWDTVDISDVPPGTATQFTGVVVGTEWDAIGPFPSGTREHPFLTSPLAAFPETSTDRKVALLDVDAAHSWPSELADGGQVGWRSFETASDGWVDVTYPEIRWQQLRDAHGWAALQHLVVLRTTLYVHPREGTSADKARPTLLELISGTEFALVRKDSEDQESAIWYNGDVYAYALESSMAQPTIFAHHVDLLPGHYVLLVRANFEIRLAGDPGSKPPDLRFRFNAGVDDLRERSQATFFEVIPNLHEVPDMVDGHFMGRHFGICLRRITPTGEDGQIWTLDKVKIKGKYLIFRGYDDFAISSDGLVVVPLHAVQNKVVKGCAKALNLTLNMLSSSGESVDVPIRLKITHHHACQRSPFRFTFTAAAHGQLQYSSDNLRYSPALISHAIAVPLTEPLGDTTGAATILALHGAGVDTTSTAWIDAIPRRKNGWAVLPTGRTSWGEDWHGGSMQDAWAARDALKPILEINGGVPWSPQSIGQGTILMGHSNGGQGAWHLASHWSDRVVGMVAAAGYTRIQDYVPYTSWAGNHHADPALMGILNSALSPYNNDLYLVNLRDVPVLAVHGAEDHNVPPQHSRLQIGLLQAHQGGQTCATMVEVPREDHWWPEVLKSSQVLNFLESLPDVKPEPEIERTISVTYNPSESGSKNGFRIISQREPGQVSKLIVSITQDPTLLAAGVGYTVDLTNTTGFTYNGRELGVIAIDETIIDTNGKIPCSFVLKDSWVCIPHATSGHIATENASNPGPMSNGPISEILAGQYAMRIVVDDQDQHQWTAALRLQHDVFLYHRISAPILQASTAGNLLSREAFGPGNLVCLGTSLFQSNVSSQKPGIISRVPHGHGDTSVAISISGVDQNSFERALRLFPLRTGVPVPHWIIVSREMDWQGAGGIKGAGYAGRQWP